MTLDLTVWPDPIAAAPHPGIAEFRGTRMRCALGRRGVRGDKREGDGATPAGIWRLGRVLYRADRLPAPNTRLLVAMIGRDDGWCDDPADPRYNQPVRLPYVANAERLWRDDGLYDLMVVIGFNVDPVVPGAGSAIFLHLARPDYGPTQGCVALALSHLLSVLEAADTESRLIARTEPPPE